MVAAAGKWLSSLGEEISSARFPVRIKVPTRDEAIAAGLSALAMGLVVGLAIGPGFGGTGSLLPAFAGPLASIAPEPAADPALALPALQSPAGSSAGQSVATSAESPMPAPAPTVVYADAPPPADAPITPASNDPAPATGGGGGGGSEQEEGLPVEATVVGVGVTGKSYAVADDSGNLFTLFANGVPAVGDRVAAEILPLSNGTFAQIGDRKSKGSRSGATMRGVVSYVDEGVGIIVLSSRGTSIPVSFEPPVGDGAEPLQVGTSLTAEVEVRDSANGLRSVATEEPVRPEPLLKLVSAETSFYDDTAIELSGKIRTVDLAARTIEMTADGEGLLDATVTLSLPRSLAAGLVVEGRQYSVTARRTAQGALQVSGLSPAFSRKAAGDRKAAFGEHA